MDSIVTQGSVFRAIPLDEATVVYVGCVKGHELKITEHYYKGFDYTFEDGDKLIFAGRRDYQAKIEISEYVEKL
jgi:hypothetical protein